MNREKQIDRKARIDSIIGRNLRAARIAKNMTREELAEIMGLSVPHIGVIERGERGATAVTLEKISKAFDLPIDNFFAKPSNSPPSTRDSYDGDDLSESRETIKSLLIPLDDNETDFILHMIRGIVCLKSRRSP